MHLIPISFPCCLPFLAGTPREFVQNFIPGKSEVLLRLMEPKQRICRENAAERRSGHQGRIKHITGTLALPLDVTFQARGGVMRGYQ